MKNKSFSELVGEAIGEASVCWSETPTGVFDSTRASEIVARILKHHDTENKIGFPCVTVNDDGDYEMPAIDLSGRMLLLCPKCRKKGTLDFVEDSQTPEEG